MTEYIPTEILKKANKNILKIVDTLPTDLVKYIIAPMVTPNKWKRKFSECLFEMKVKFSECDYYEVLNTERAIINGRLWIILPYYQDMLFENVRLDYLQKWKSPFYKDDWMTIEREHLLCDIRYNKEMHKKFKIKKDL